MKLEGKGVVVGMGSQHFSTIKTRVQLKIC